MTNPDLERLVFVSIELSMYEFSYLQVADTNLYDKIINLREEKQKLKAKIEEDLEKWDNFPSCNHSCDCTDCQIKCVRCIIQLKTGHFESDITQLRESNQELINNEEKLEQEIESLKQELQVKVLEIALLKEKLADKDHIMTQLHNNVKKVFDSIYQDTTKEDIEEELREALESQKSKSKLPSTGATLPKGCG